MAPEPSALLLFGNSAAAAEDVVVGATKDQKKEEFENEAESTGEKGVRLADMPH